MKRQTGFTLTEMMVALAIVAILMTIAGPSYQYITNSNRMSSEVNALLGDMEYAREEAIKEGQNITVCSSTTGTTCAASPNWQTGWIVFSNTNPPAAQPAAGVLRAGPAFSGSDTFVSSPNTVTAITFNREGFATAAGFVATTIVLHIATGASQWTKCLYVSAQGMMQAETIAQDPSGTCTS